MIVKAITKGKELRTFLIEGNSISYKTDRNVDISSVRFNSPSVSDIHDTSCLVVNLDGETFAFYDSVVYIINKEGKTIDKIIV